MYLFSFSLTRIVQSYKGVLAITELEIEFLEIECENKECDSNLSCKNYEF